MGSISTAVFVQFQCMRFLLTSNIDVRTLLYFILCPPCFWWRYIDSVLCVCFFFNDFFFNDFFIKTVHVLGLAWMPNSPAWIENPIEYKPSKDKSVLNVYAPCSHTPVSSMRLLPLGPCSFNVRRTNLLKGGYIVAFNPPAPSCSECLAC